jgi:hypothetical protein
MGKTSGNQGWRVPTMLRFRFNLDVAIYGYF